MAEIVQKQERVVVSVDDLDQGIRDVAFEAKVVNRYGTYDRVVANKLQTSYQYLYCDLLDRGGFTTITLMCKTEMIPKHEACLKKGLFVRVENFGLQPKSNNSYQQGDMPMMIVVGDTTLVSNISPFEPELVPMFFHTGSIAEFRCKAYNKWANATLAVIVVGVLGERSTKIGSSSSSSGVKLLQVADGPNIHDHDALAMGPSFKDEYDQLVESYYGGQCTMVLIKNVGQTSSDDRQLFAKDHTIFAQIAEESVRAHLYDLHNKLSGKERPLREVCLN